MRAGTHLRAEAFSPDFPPFGDIVIDEPQPATPESSMPAATVPQPVPPEPVMPRPAMDPWPPAPVAAARVPPAPGPARRGGRHWLLAGLVGGLVGALVASGVFVVTDDDSTSSTTTVVRQPADAAVSRDSRTISETGDLASIIAKVEPAVVAITTADQTGEDTGAGTGFVITSDGYIVTNNHVAEGASGIRVAFTNGDEKTARLVGREAASDLAVLKVDAANLATVELGDSDDVQVGDDVVAIGNALALDGGLSVTRGIVSGLHREVPTDSGAVLIGMLQTDAAINFGNSGGPLVDSAGRVIAINTAIASPQESNNVGFGIPISNAIPVIDDLRLGRAAAFLGVSTQTVTPALAREQSLAASEGALVTRVNGGSAAAAAGLRVGDVIVRIDGKAVNEASDVQALIRSRRPGDAVDVVVIRDGGERTLTATLTERPAA